MNRFCQCALAIVTVLSVEGVSFAGTTAGPTASVAAQGATPVATGHSLNLSASLRDLAALASEMDEGASGASSSDVLSGIRLCHISHHPRDGIRAEVHACPLLIADFDVASSQSTDVSIAVVSSSVQVD